MTKTELRLYQWLRRTRHFDPVLYGVVLVVTAWVIATLAYIGMIIFFVLA